MGEGEDRGGGGWDLCDLLDDFVVDVGVKGLVGLHECLIHVKGVTIFWAA